MFHMLDMRPGQPTYMEQLARAFEALRKALTSLQHDYETSQLAIRQPTFIPYPLQDVRLVSCSNSTAGNINVYDNFAHATLACLAFCYLFGTLNSWAECRLPSYHTCALDASSNLCTLFGGYALLVGEESQRFHSCESLQVGRSSTTCKQ